VTGRKSLTYPGPSWISAARRSSCLPPAARLPPSISFMLKSCWPSCSPTWLDAWQKGEALEFRKLYGFDPKTETIEKLADGPTAFYETQLAYDSNRELFVTVAAFNKKEQPSGMFGYDPRKNAWHESRRPARFRRTQVGTAG
jgi:hypothetical protein